MVLLNLLAALVLLLWGTRQMRRGLHELPASWLDALARHAARGRYAAWAAGLAAGLLQAPEDPVRRVVRLARLERLPAPAQHAAILGGTVGCALAVLAFTSAPGWTFHLLLIAGAAAWSPSRRQRVRTAGRALFGAGVVLLALQILAIAGAPGGNGTLVSAVARGLEQELLLAAVLGVLAALLLRSLFAAVLLVAAVAASWLPTGPVLALLAGVHVGSALASFSRQPAGIAERRLAAGHAIAMLLASGALLLVLPDASRLLGALDGVDLAFANAAFCGLLAVVFLNLAGPLARLVRHLLPEPAAPTEASALRHVEAVDPADSSVALSAALRQVMGLANLVSEMLRQATAAILENDRAAIDAVYAAEQEVDELYRDTKQYLARIPHHPMAASEQRRWEEIMVFLIALEQIADGVDRMLPRAEAWNAKRQFAYPPAAQAEFRELHGLLTRNLHMAAGLCLERWPGSATALLAAEEAFRDLERSICAAHIGRVAAGDPASIAVSGAHLDLMAELAHMNTRLCGFARFFQELQEAAARAEGVAPARPANDEEPVGVAARVPAR